MIKRRLEQIRHECLRRLGRSLAGVRLHRLRFETIDGVELVLKKRKFWARFSLPPGNLILILTGRPFRVLPERDWIAWEWTVDRAAGRHLLTKLPSRRGRGLAGRRVPGQALSRVLADPALDAGLKIEAVHAALSALRTLHRVPVDWGDGLMAGLSHGDATAHNVLVDLDQNRACWIDFDTRHLPGLPELDRQADDLRCLLESSAVFLPESRYADLASVFAAEISQPLRLRLVEALSRPTFAGLAQAPLSLGQARKLGEAMRAAFELPRLEKERGS